MKKNNNKQKLNNDIAIIGVAGKFADAKNLQEYWENLKNGKNSIGEMKGQRKKDADDYLDFSKQEAYKKRYLKRGYITEIDKFDYDFFGISHKEACLIDPNQRLFLQIACASVEDAGYTNKTLKGSDTGVYLGFYRPMQFRSYAKIVEETNLELAALAASGNLDSIIASRVSHWFDLKGPCISIDTACSSSLVALHYACEDIRKGKCNLAIVGSVNIDVVSVDRNNNILMNSRQDKTKAFDNDSDGTAWGEGVVSVVLKSLSKAIEDRDNIHAVVKGSDLNQDGKSISLSAPDVKAQVKVIQAVWEKYNIDPETISYIEAHGTGTHLGDLIEIEGIKRAFDKHTKKKQFCGTGSVKTNIGHLENVAGLASVLKIILAMKHEQLPPTINLDRPNKLINFEDSPVFLNDRLRKWETSDKLPRICGVSSFGFSGTNSHAVLEEPPILKNKTNNKGVNIFVLSAKTKEALKLLTEKYCNFLDREKNVDLNDLCFTASTARNHYPYRLAIIISSIKDLNDKLKHLVDSDLKSGDMKNVFISDFSSVFRDKKEDFNIEITKEDFENQESLVNIFREIGKEYVNGVEVLWQKVFFVRGNKVSLPTYPFAETRCWINFKNKKDDVASLPLIEKCVYESDEERICETEFSKEKFWVVSGHRAKGKNIMVGTTYLELAAEAAKKWLAESKFMFSDVLYLEPLAFKDDEVKKVQIKIKKTEDCFEFQINSLRNEEAQEWIRHAEGKISKIKKAKERRVDIKKLVSENIRVRNKKELGERMRGVSNYELNERWINIDQMYDLKLDREWVSHVQMQAKYKKELDDFILHPALFDNVFPTELVANANELFLPFSYKSIKVFHRLPSEFFCHIRFNKNSGKNFLDMDITLLDKTGKVVIEIENYLYKKSDSFSEKDFFYQTVWQEQKSAEQFVDIKQLEDRGSILVFSSASKKAKELIEKFRQVDKEIIEVKIEDEFKKVSNNKYSIGSSQEDYEKLIKDLIPRNISRMVHLSTLRNETEIKNFEDFDEIEKTGVMSLFYLTKAVQRILPHQLIDMTLVTDYANKVSGGEKTIKPENAIMIGFGRSISMEDPNIKCGAIDIDDKTSVDLVFSEIYSPVLDYELVYRDNKKYIEKFDKLDISKIKDNKAGVKDNGVYLIAGGLGGVGLEIAKSLSQENTIKLVLVGRTKFPERNEWKNILEAEGPRNVRLLKKINTIKAIEESGSEVMLLRADISKEKELEKAIKKVKDRFTKIDGVIHSAGIAGDGFIVTKSEKTLREVLESKVRGTWLLDHLTRDENLDFFILFSSTASIHGSPGQSDYTAANAYLDSYSVYREKYQGGSKAINWSTWGEAGMAYDKQTQFDIFVYLDSKKATYLFSGIVQKKINNLVIGQLNFDSELLAEEKLTRIFSPKIKAELNQKSKKIDIDYSNKKVKILGREDNKYSQREREFAQIWSFALDRDEIRLDDNFFENGGDSLSAMRVLNAINKKMNLHLSIIDLFKNPTISSLIQGIEEVNKKNKAKDEDFKKNTEKLISSIKKGEVSIDEAVKKISK